MKSEKFTLTKHMSFGRFIKMSMLSALLTIWYSGLQAQCPLACNNLVQVSMDEDCKVQITYQMMLEGESSSSTCIYIVEVLGTNGVPLAPPTGETGNNWVTSANIGQTLTVRVRVGANSCWGKIKIEDKLPPSFTPCPDDITISCYDTREFGKPVATDNCGGVVSPDKVTILSDVTTDLNCDPSYRARRVIRYQAVDASGNLSEICNRVITYRKITLDSINCPLNYDSTPGNFKHLSCDGTYRNLNDVKLTWDTNGNGYPDVAETGYPFFDNNPTATIGTVIGMLNNNTLCKINVTFTDTELPICAESFKILRQWSILDWCTGTVKTCNQILKVVDDTPPLVTKKPEQASPFCTDAGDGAGAVLLVNPYTCTAEISLIDITDYIQAITDCDTAFTYTVSFKKSPNPFGPTDCDDDPYPGLPFVTSDATTSVFITPVRISTQTLTGRTVTFENKYGIKGLPLGRTWVKFTVSDRCGNKVEIDTEIDVIDKTPPVAVCDEYTVVTLSNNGFARVFANTFDDGSHDNCTPVGFQVSRMNAGCGNRDENPTSQQTPGRYVQFCCDDLNIQNVDGNRDGRIDELDRGYLQVILTVWDDANLDGIYGPQNANGNFTNPNYTDNSNTCMVLIKVEDKVPPTITCPSNKTINCGADTTLLASERPDWSTTPLTTPYFTDNCGATMFWTNSGSIDNCGQGVITRTFRVTDSGGRTATCVQTITVRNRTPFTGASIVWPTSPITITGCKDADTDPAKTGTVKPGAGACSQVAFTKEDQLFPFVEDVCFKILRKWTVIDWCKFSPNRDTLGSIYPSIPTLGINMWSFTQIIKVSEDQKPVLSTCSKADTDIFGPDCNGFVELKNSATDCTPPAQLKWTYLIDPNNDGVGSTISGSTNDASGTFPIGTHGITWTVEDMCGNQSTCTYTFRVLDKKKPTPYCISQLTTVVMPVQGEIEIWARDFDRGSFDNCPGVLRFSSVNRFPTTRSDSVWRFTCSDFPAGKDTIQRQLRMYVWDEAQNSDFCTVTLIIQKNSACGGSAPGGRLAGTIGTERNDMIKDVQVILQNLGSLESTSLKTDNNGRFEFANIPQNVGYKISPNKDDDHLNGVSTLDLVMIQRHILDIQKFNTAYQYIAADVNDDKKVTAGDLVELRKLILGIYPDFPNNKSWRFLDKAVSIPDFTTPWGVNESISIANFNTSVLANHFMGVKIGDLNSSAVVNANAPATEVRSKALTMVANDVEYVSGQTVRMDVTAENFTNIAGAQWTLNFDRSSMDFSNIVTGGLKLNNENFNVSQANNGKISFSWNDFNGLTISENEVLLSIEFIATANNTIGKTVKLSSDITRAEAYTKDLSEINMSLAIRSGKSSENIFALDQNNPNPFTSNTTISFTLPEAGQAKLTIFDITGKILKTFTNEYHKGRNEVIVNAEEINAQGVMFYELESKGLKATKKMIYLSK